MSGQGMAWQQVWVELGAAGEPGTACGRADLHVHTSASFDCPARPADIIWNAVQKGLTAVAVTDHDTVAGWGPMEEAARKAEDLGLAHLEIIRGEEVSTRDGHLLALFIEEWIAPHRPLLDTVREVHAQGGVAVVAHPLSPLVSSVRRRLLDELAGDIDGLEVLNPSWGGYAARRTAWQLNRLYWHLAATGGSDAHLARYVGQAVTVYPGATALDLKAALLEAATEAAGAPHPWYAELVTIGSAFSQKSAQRLSAILRAQGRRAARRSRRAWHRMVGGAAAWRLRQGQRPAAAAPDSDSQFILPGRPHRPAEWESRTGGVS
ncbi:MAG: CehA/McbA family metallohydrolase [Firmicutes bacterium]|nr:CehA/McbA family metallohydrolase [Bacillota bacterium]